MTLARRVRSGLRSRRRRVVRRSRTLHGLVALTPALGLLAPCLFPLVARSVAHLVAPTAPSPIGGRACLATVPLKMVASDEPAATALEKALPQANARSKMTSRLTIGRCGTRLGWAHGRYLLPIGSSPGAGADDSAPGRFFNGGLSAYGDDTITLPYLRDPRPPLNPDGPLFPSTPLAILASVQAPRAGDGREGE